GLVAGRAGTATNPRTPPVPESSPGTRASRRGSVTVVRRNDARRGPRTVLATGTVVAGGTVERQPPVGAGQTSSTPVDDANDSPDASGKPGLRTHPRRDALVRIRNRHLSCRLGTTAADSQLD